jgi:exonuclease III
MWNNLYISHLSIASWNVQGLIGKSYNKLKDPSFLQELKKHHVIALIETHCTTDTSITIPGYYTHQVCRPKSNSKAHGGIAILVRSELRAGIKFYHATTNDIIWVCLKKEFFNTNQDIYIGAVYLSPVNSTYTKKLDYNPFDIQEKELAKYCEKGQSILLGDVNARSSTSQDFVLNNDAKHIPVPSGVTLDGNCACRKSQDYKMIKCAYGKQLIDLCIASGLKIANGRVLGDPSGRYTCHKYNGSSLVDYVLVDNTTLSQVRYFKVDDLIGDLSDHCLISFGLAVSVTLQHASKKCRNVPRKYKWFDGAESKINDILGNEENSQAVNDMLHNDILDINCSIEAINKLLCGAASQCLKQTNTKKKSNTGKRWFNISCSNLRKEVKCLSKRLTRNPNDQNIRSCFFRAKKLYKKQLKYSKLSFKQNLSKKLEDASEQNPKLYWKILEELKNIDKTDGDEVSPISAEDWAKHFRELYKPQVLTESDGKIIAELEKAEQTKVFNELSFLITIEEIQNAINELKLGKAAGPDNISGELLKASASFILPTLLKVFNYILSNGTFPTQWAEGTISPIHKKASKLLPDNYRGITVSSSLGKVFGIVMNNRLKSFCEKHSLIDERQSSHRKNTRTTDNVFII